MWIVLWLVTQTSPVECPDYKPDPYTGAYPLTHCAVYHAQTTRSVLTKEFETTAEANEFIDAAPPAVKDKMKLVYLDTNEGDIIYGGITGTVKP